MRIRGRCALPPDVESSTLQPPRHPQPQSLSSTTNSISLEQDAVIGTAEDEADTATCKNPAATAPTCRKYDCNSMSSEIAADTDTSISSSSSHVAVGWLEEDKALPLKKRRLVGLLDIMKQDKEPISETIAALNMKSNIETIRAKRKRTEKIWTDYVLQVHWVADYKKARSSRRRNMMNEMKRCNRQNGKGWRCSLPALAGHTLCDHHFTEQKKKTSRRRARL